MSCDTITVIWTIPWCSREKFPHHKIQFETSTLSFFCYSQGGLPIISIRYIPKVLRCIINYSPLQWVPVKFLISSWCGNYPLLFFKWFLYLSEALEPVLFLYDSIIDSKNEHLFWLLLLPRWSSCFRGRKNFGINEIFRTAIYFSINWYSIKCRK